MIPALFDPASEWTIALAIGYPVLAILLVELQRALKPRQPDLGKIASLLQVTVLPPFAIWLIASQVARVPADGVAMKLILSVLAITTINACLALLNVLMRSGIVQANWIERTPALMLDLARLFLVLIAAAFVASEIWAVDLGSLLAALGVGSVVLGLALQDTLSGLFAGVSLLSGRHFKEGDWIEFGEVSGKIVEMNWRTVTIETLDDERLIVIPNSALSSSNFTVLMTGKRSYGENVYVSFSYGAPPARVMDALDRAVRAVDLILEDPPHDIDLARHDETGIVYEVTIHTKTREDGEAAITEFLRKLWYICAREGLVLSGAANRRFDNAGHDLLSASEMAAVLAGLDLFAASEADLETLARAARNQLYDEGEILQGFGAAFDKLYLVIKGGIGVSTGDGADSKLVQRLEPREVFLARALLTSGPSPVALSALSEVSVIAIPAQALLRFLSANPHLARRFEAVIDLTEHGLVVAATAVA